MNNFLLPGLLQLLSIVASHSCTEGDSLGQCEADASYLGMTNFSSLVKLKFNSRLFIYSSACQADEGSTYT